jgi:hypothetical protein
VGSRRSAINGVRDLDFRIVDGRQNGRLMDAARIAQAVVRIGAA